MSTLLYRGFNSDGYRVGGAKGFANKSQLEAYLDKRGITNAEIFESKTIYKERVYGLVDPKGLSIFCKQMSVLFISHITIMEGIFVLSEQTDNKQLQITLSEIYEFMNNGLTFSEAMSMYDHIFPTYLLNMIVIGETSGTLDTVFSRMSNYFEKEAKIRKKVRSAITYPAILTALMASIVILLIVKVLPMFEDILSSMGSQMPPATEVILGAGTFLSDYGIFIIIVLAALILGCILYIRSEKGTLWFDKAKFSIPGYNYITSRVTTTHFARSLSILLRSGVQLLNALEDISKLMDNRYLEKKLTEAVQQVKNGDDMAAVLQKIGVFPAMFMKMFIVGEKTGNLDEMLEKSASVFDDEVDDAVERFTAMLEPILIIILSVIVGIILLSVMIPMISIMNAIG